MSGKIHFKITHGGVTRRFAILRTEEDIVSALKTRILKISGDGDLPLFWKDDDSLIVLESEDDLTAAIDYAETKNKLACVTLETGTVKEEEKEEEKKIVTESESAAAFDGFPVWCNECDCHLAPSNGGRFMCSICEDYDLCANCFAKRVHANHAFVFILDSNTEIPLKKDAHLIVSTLAKDTPACTPTFTVTTCEKAAKIGIEVIGGTEKSDADKIVETLERWNDENERMMMDDDKMKKSEDTENLNTIVDDIVNAAMQADLLRQTEAQKDAAYLLEKKEDEENVYSRTKMQSIKRDLDGFSDSDEGSQIDEYYSTDESSTDEEDIIATMSANNEDVRNDSTYAQGSVTEEEMQSLEQEECEKELEIQAPVNSVCALHNKSSNCKEQKRMEKLPDYVRNVKETEDNLSDSDDANHIDEYYSTDECAAYADYDPEYIEHVLSGKWAATPYESKKEGGEPKAEDAISNVKKEKENFNGAAMDNEEAWKMSSTINDYLAVEDEELMELTGLYKSTLSPVHTVSDGSTTNEQQQQVVEREKETAVRNPLGDEATRGLGNNGSSLVPPPYPPVYPGFHYPPHYPSRGLPCLPPFTFHCNQTHDAVVRSDLDRISNPKEENRFESGDTRKKNDPQANWRHEKSDLDGNGRWERDGDVYRHEQHREEKSGDRHDRYGKGRYFGEWNADWYVEDGSARNLNDFREGRGYRRDEENQRSDGYSAYRREGEARRESKDEEHLRRDRADRYGSGRRDQRDRGDQWSPEGNRGLNCFREELGRLLYDKPWTGDNGKNPWSGRRADDRKRGGHGFGHEVEKYHHHHGGVHRERSGRGWDERREGIELIRERRWTDDYEYYEECKRREHEREEDQYKVASQIPAFMTITILDELMDLKKKRMDELLLHYIDRITHNAFNLVVWHYGIFRGVSASVECDLIAAVARDLEKHLRSLAHVTRSQTLPKCLETLGRRKFELKKALKELGSYNTKHSNIAAKLRIVLITTESDRYGMNKNWDEVATGFMEADPNRNFRVPPRVPSANPEKEGLFAPVPKNCFH